MKYKARPGYRISDAEAQAIGETAEKIKKDGIPLTPSALIERARIPESPIHHLFNWDDEAAADLYRRKQARNLLAGIVIIEMKTRHRVKAYYSLDLTTEDPLPEAERVYKSRKEILVSDSDKHQLSFELFHRIKQACEEAESLGFATEFPEWNRIITLIKMSPLNKQQR